MAEFVTEPAVLAGIDVSRENWRVTTASLVRMVMALGLPETDPHSVVAALSRQLAALNSFDMQEDLRPVDVPAAAGRLLYNGVAVTAALANVAHDSVAVSVLTRLVLRMFEIDQVTVVSGHLRAPVRGSCLPGGGLRFEDPSDGLGEAQFEAIVGQLRDDTEHGVEPAGRVPAPRFVLVPLPQVVGRPVEDCGRPPTVFISYAHDSPEHKDQVRRFAGLLRDSGVDVVLDQWVSPGRQDWGTWAVRSIVRCDFTIIIASPNYKRAADDLDDSRLNLGVQSEAAVIRDELHGDRPRWKRKLLPVVLPGHTKAEIPYFLQPHSADRYHVDSLDTDGISGLMATLNAGPAPEDRIIRPAVPVEADDNGGSAPHASNIPPALGSTSMTATNSGNGRIFQAGRDQHITGA